MDSCARTSVHRKEVLVRPGLLTLPGLPSSRIIRRMELSCPSHLFHLLTEQMACHIYVRLSHRPHQMQERYEQLRYHLSMLHKYHMLHKMLFYSALRRSHKHTDKAAHTLCTQDPDLCMSQELHKPLHHSPHRQVYQEPYQEGQQPCNKYSRRQLLLSHSLLPGSHRVRC